MKRMSMVLAASVAAALSMGSAFAAPEQLTESKITAGYGAVKLPGMPSADGFGVSAGLQYDNNVYIRGSITRSSQDILLFGDTYDVDTRTLTFTMGRQYHVTPSSVLFAELTGARMDAKVDGFKLPHDTDWAASVGYKASVSDNIVVAFSLDHTDKELGMSGSMQYALSKDVAVSFGYSLHDSAKGYSIGFSYYF